MTATRTYWHVAHTQWHAGEPLRSRNALAEAGIDIPWLWDEAPDGVDCDLVSLFPDTMQGRTEAGWLLDDRPGYTLLRVEIPADDDAIEITRTEWEPYPAVRYEIPSGYLTVATAKDLT